MNRPTPDSIRTMALTDERAGAVVTVHYHRNLTGQGFYATCGLWSGPTSCDTLPGLRDLMLHLLQGAYRSRCYFELTDSTFFGSFNPAAWEEFAPVVPDA